MGTLRILRAAALVAALVPSLALAASVKPEKIPVALGSWKGPKVGTFKDAMRRGLGKDCKIVGAKAARVVIEGTVSEQGKGFVLRVIVKLPKSGEVVEQRDFPFPKPRASKAQSDKMGRVVAEIARRAPAE